MKVQIYKNKVIKTLDTIQNSEEDFNAEKLNKQKYVISEEKYNQNNKDAGFINTIPFNNSTENLLIFNPNTNRIEYYIKSLDKWCYLKNDDGGGFLSKCRVYFDGNTTFAIGTPKKVPFNYINFDINTEWDATNKRFIVKEAGYYILTGQINWANYKSIGFLMFYRNYGLTGADSLLMIGGINTQALYLTGTTINYLNIGDYIEMWGMASNGICYGGTTNTFFAIHRLS